MAIYFEKFKSLLIWFVVMRDDEFSNILGQKISVSLSKIFFGIPKDHLLLLMLDDSFEAVHTNLG